MSPAEGEMNDFLSTDDDDDEKKDSDVGLKIGNFPWKKGWKVTLVMENEDSNLHLNFHKKKGQHTATLVPDK